VLREAKDIAVKASHSMDEFIASISHEIGTPLSGMIGVMQMLRSTRLDRNQGRQVDTASNSANMLLTIINDMVDLSHIETGRFPVTTELFVLSELIEDVAYILARAACDKGLELVSDIDPEIPHLVKSDPVRLRQVLNNLLNNAIKFTAQGVIVVYARRNENLVEIGVTDTGVALSESQKQKILQPFPGDENRYRRRSDHSGVGLTISRRLVEAMGSAIHIESGPEPGNHIYFDIPVDQDQTAVYDWHPPRALQRLTVVILSPVEQRRESIQKILAHWNISRSKGLNYSAESESELPDIAPCDLVIIDQVGAGQWGNDLIEKFGNRSDWRKTRFVHLLPQGINTEDGRADVRINKPLSQARLYAALMDVVYRQSLKNKPQQGDKNSSPQLQGRRILLVEDNEINKTIVLEILEETGADIDIAGDGAQAVEQVQRAEYDLILMDIQMPVMDGFEATRQIRKLGHDYENIPIIAMTAYAQEGDSDKSIEAGMNHHMTKTFEPESFIELVVGFIKGRSQ
jgi:CheY-like chemotaxis protein